MDDTTSVLVTMAELIALGLIVEVTGKGWRLTERGTETAENLLRAMPDRERGLIMLYAGMAIKRG